MKALASLNPDHGRTARSGRKTERSDRADCVWAWKLVDHWWVDIDLKARTIRIEGLEGAELDTLSQ